MDGHVGDGRNLPDGQPVFLNHHGEQTSLPKLSLPEYKQEACQSEKIL
jgi:hypothetical protein